MSNAFTYSRWDDTQSVFNVNDDALLDEFSESLLSRGDVSSALRSMTQRGLQPDDGGKHVEGVQDLLQKLRADRQELLQRFDMNSPIDDLRRRLDEVIEAERGGMDERVRSTREQASRMHKSAQDGGAASLLDPDTAQQLVDQLEEMVDRNRERLDALPKELAGAVRELGSYEFVVPEAHRLFDELKEMMQQQFVDRRFDELSQTLREQGSQDWGAVKRMMKDLNEMLERQIDGDAPRFDEFMEKWGEAFGDDPPQSLEELVTRLQRQAAQMLSLMSSLSSEQRQQLDELVEGLLEDVGLRNEMAELAQNLQLLSPTGEFGRRYPFHGSESLALEDALDTFDMMQRMDDLERQLKLGQQSGSIDQVDEGAVKDLLGEESFQSLEELRKLTERLETAGHIRLNEDGKFELTPRGMRRIGERALSEIFTDIRKHYGGQHGTRDLGRGGEPADGTKPYSFGDQFSIHLQRTIHNAIVKGSAGTPVRLHPDDFEVYEMEEIAQSSTVLLLDLSLSMAMRGNFLAAKKVALALDNLIRTQFQRDRLYIVGFSTYAREMKVESLTYLSWDEFDPYTNIQHGLAVAQKLLTRQKSGTKQIIMISDGEPTAHMENGQLFLQYPPSPRTIRETLKEVRRATQAGVTINTFMLERNSFLMEFVDDMTRINKGRIFYTTADHLGEYIMVDYLSTRKKTFVA
jgi:uncharacterized protein with von Willebrand factor type A (vWA) domain